MHLSIIDPPKRNVHPNHDGAKTLRIHSFLYPAIYLNISGATPFRSPGIFLARCIFTRKNLEQGGEIATNIPCFAWKIWTPQQKLLGNSGRVVQKSPGKFENGLADFEGASKIAWKILNSLKRYRGCFENRLEKWNHACKIATNIASFAWNFPPLAWKTASNFWPGKKIWP